MMKAKRWKQKRAKLKQRRSAIANVNCLSINLVHDQEMQYHDKRTKLDCGFIADPTTPTQKKVLRQLKKTQEDCSWRTLQ